MTPEIHDPIISRMMEQRVKMTDVDAAAEQERRNRMYVMLRSSIPYPSLRYVTYTPHCLPTDGLANTSSYKSRKLMPNGNRIPFIMNFLKKR
ncbi:hypothetical protein BCR33DRAFT_154109 [Rhizoclosmatium globosum]|uniref:Uncharacterized protein n=1 Tax=Rhizoclosmatium globosum TaxID=329046 RepID=A0A1Y2CFQ2_9FUNG|nr:hypothetical protein BCR33DRAFT_154109 [Rhizoclosmatium globosum]|eukprot:ORY45859.1 hypothetical protein BCR33DRAFT_154109 [Rhizoclosmatium globosum]